MSNISFIRLDHTFCMRKLDIETTKINLIDDIYYEMIKQLPPKLSPDDVLHNFKSYADNFNYMNKLKKQKLLTPMINSLLSF